MLPEGKCRYIDGQIYPDGNFYVLDTQHIKHNGSVLKSALNSINTDISNKVDKVAGKGLSTEDYTTAEKDKLSGIEAGANAYTLPAATASSLGGVKVGSNLAVDANGVVRGNYSNATTSAAGLMSAADKIALNGKPDVYVQSSQPSGLKTGDIWFEIIE